MSEQRLVAYYRVSTRKQVDGTTERDGVEVETGLGLEAQEAAVQAYARSKGAIVLRSYTEVESGKKADRPELAKAIAHARNAKAVLVVAKLDRLARNVAFLSALMEAGLDFVCCDMPEANRMVLHIMVAIAEGEAKMISERTKAGMAATKARGTLLGSADPRCRHNMTPEAREKGILLSRRIRMEKARYADLVPSMLKMQADGLDSRQIADRLNEDGYRTSRGNPWYPLQVRLVLKRAAMGN